MLRQKQPTDPARIDADIYASEDEWERNRPWYRKLQTWTDFHLWVWLGFCPYCHGWRCGD